MQLLRQFLVQYNGSPPAQTGGLFHFIHAGFRGVKGIVDPDLLFYLIAVVIVGILGDGFGIPIVLFALQQTVVGIVPVINGVVLVAGCNQFGSVAEIVKLIFISLDNVTVLRLSVCFY